MHRSLYDVLCKTASEHAHRIAWIDPAFGSAQSIRWSEFRQHVDRLALWLSDNGIQASDRVVNLEPNSPGWAMLDLACAALGAIHSPIDPRWNQQQFVSAIQSLEPKAIFSDIELNLAPSHTRPIAIQVAMQQATAMPSQRRCQLWQESLRIDQTANILWTSGTSAEPKGVMLSHGNLLSNALAKLDAMPQNADDLRLNLLPFAHAYARTCELTTWLISGSSMASVLKTQALIDAAQLLQPTLINAVPSVYEYILGKTQTLEAIDGSNSLRSLLGQRIRQLASGGAAIRDSLRQRFAQESLPIFQGYGLTEASPVVCSNRAQQELHGRRIEAILDGVGPPVRDVELRIDSHERLWVKGPGIMQGYWRNELATQQRIQDGWLDTGDCVSLDQAPGLELKGPSQAIRIAGRADDIQVLSTGHKFSPRLLEHPIEQIEGVEACVVVGTHRRRPIAILCMKPQSRISETHLLEQIHGLLQNQPEHLQISQAIICPESWTPENGLRNWKGGVNRKEIARRFAPQ
jgi:long-chain acyl-CoA synthetase